MVKDPTRVAAGKKSKRKGSSFELKLAKEFQKWWDKGEFCRSPGSGGWGRPQHKQGFNASGDIITTNRDFPWCLELKHQEGWTLDQLLLNDGCIIHSWWEQTVDETPDDLLPMLIFKKNRQKPMVMVFRDNMPCPGAPLADRLAKGSRKFYTVDRNGKQVLIFVLEDLLSERPALFGRID